MHAKCAENFDPLTVVCFVCLKNCMIEIIGKHSISWYCQNSSVTLGQKQFPDNSCRSLMHLIPWHWNIHHVNWKVICPRDFLYPRKRVSIWSVIWMLDCVIVIVYLCYNWLAIDSWTFRFFAFSIAELLRKFSINSVHVSWKKNSFGFFPNPFEQKYAGFIDLRRYSIAFEFGSMWRNV